MNRQRKRQPGSMFAIALVLGALLGGCGTEQPTGKTLNTMSGAATVGTPAAGLDTCMSCHPATTDEWEGTAHANLNSSPSFTTAAACTICHDQQGDSQFFSPVTMVVGCESCHSGGAMHVEGGGSGPIGFVAANGTTLGSVAVSGMYATCTQCHELLNSTGTGTATPLTPGWHGSTYKITDTHYAVANTFAGSRGTNAITSGVAVTGYTMDYSSERICIDCHDPHNTDTTINLEWTKSGHADTGGAASGYYFSGAWAVVNWSCNGTNTAGCGTPAPADNRQCQLCHTSSGFITYSTAISNNDSASADLMRTGQVSLVTYTAGWKPEMLLCNGCHTDNKGTVRNPGQVTANYDLFTSTTNSSTGAVTLTYQAYASHQYPDVAESNLCLLCHIGRESGETITNLNSSTSPTTVDLNNASFVQTHYLTGGGTVFAATGYAYAGRAYDNPGTYRHDKIGTSAEPNTGTKGPCIGCHMSRPNGSGNHLFLPVARSTVTAGEITAVASEVCFRCHILSSSDIKNLVNEERELFEAAIEALLYQLDRAKMPYTPGFSYPYFQKHRYNAGTVLVTQNSPTVTGISTAFLTGPTTSITTSTDRFRTYIDAYRIASVNSETELRLTTPYTGVTATVPYEVLIYGTTSGSANALKDWDPADSGGTNGGTVGKNNMGAALNAYTLDHDPGAYVHNRMYAKRLIYDSLDWLDDNKMNWSVGDTLNKLTVQPFKLEAMEYLLADPSGGLAFNPAERP